MSTLSWLAHSEAERRRTLEVIRLLEEPGTVDDIGIGGIRDAFSELLFPGTSVIQTRARYFLFVPWIYKEVERRAPVRDSRAEADRRERRLVEALNASGDEGVIGARAGAGVKTLPSSIYWRGLQLWGIRNSNIGSGPYHRWLERASFMQTADDSEPGPRSIWHPELPSPPAEFPDKADFSLTAEEGDYLRDRVMTVHSGTLLAALVSRPTVLPDADRPWDLAGHLAGQATPEALDQLHHARCFAEVIHGAQLLYNVILGEASARREEEAGHRDSFAKWATEIDADRDRLAAWFADRPAFWEQVRRGNRNVRHRARQFTERWFDLTASVEPHALVDDPNARMLIKERERMLKGRLARLHNRSALEAWNGASGVQKLDYRWGTVRTLLDDVTAPLIEAPEYPTSPAAAT